MDQPDSIDDQPAVIDHCADEAEEVPSTSVSYQSVLSYPGGKKRAINQLRGIVDQHFPRTSTLYSPFHGGLSFELDCLSRGLVVHANDLFTPLSEFWQQVQQDRQAIEAIYLAEPRPVTAERVAEFRSELCAPVATVDRAHRAAYFLFVNKCSWSGQTLSGRVMSNRANQAKDRAGMLRANYLVRCGPLQGIHFTNLDALQWLDSVPVDDERVLVYADPHYVLKPGERGLYGVNGDHHKGFDHEKFRDALVKHPRWILTYNDCVEVRTLYAGYTMLPLTFHYTTSLVAGQREIATELVILSTREQ